MVWDLHTCQGLTYFKVMNELARASGIPYEEGKVWLMRITMGDVVRRHEQGKEHLNEWTKEMVILHYDKEYLLEKVSILENQVSMMSKKLDQVEQIEKAAVQAARMSRSSERKLEALRKKIREEKANGHH